jgi:threonine aldolase
MNFFSDNAAAASPRVMAALAAANTGTATSYGKDAWAARVEARFAAILPCAHRRGGECAVAGQHRPALGRDPRP